MIEPLPNCFSIWLNAAASALLLLSSIKFSFLKMVADYGTAIRT
jgi:hypothetical protein